MTTGSTMFPPVFLLQPRHFRFNVLLLPPSQQRQQQTARRCHTQASRNQCLLTASQQQQQQTEVLRERWTILSGKSLLCLGGLPLMTSRNFGLFLTPSPIVTPLLKTKAFVLSSQNYWFLPLMSITSFYG